MKHYNQPQTKFLQVNAQTMQMQAVSSGPVQAPKGQLETMTKNYVNW